MPASNKKYVSAVAIIILIVLAYVFLNMPDRRSPTEKLGDAIHDIDKGPDKAARQLENRTPGEKLDDAVKDAGDNMKKTTNPQ